MKNIYQRIADVMSEIQYLSKDDEVQTGKNSKSYKAITEEKVTNEVRKSMIKNGIIIVPVEMNVKKEDETLKDNYGNEKKNHFTSVDVRYRIQNIDDEDDYIIAVSSGTGVDTQDKGIGKAMTYSYKYLLLRTFAIPTGEDADKISSELYEQQFSERKAKISNELVQEMRASIKENNIKTEHVINVLVEYKYKTLSDIEEINYNAIMKKIFG